jgi:AIPR protein
MMLSIPMSQEQIRSFQDPNRKAIRIIHALVRVLDWPNNVPLDPDPRVPKEKGPVVKRICASLGTGDGRFHLLNRGITLSVKKAEFDNQTDILRLHIPDEEAYGIIDGGHTDFAIKKTVEEKREKGTEDTLSQQFVHVEILSKIENELADIAEARNYSAQLKSWTLASYRDDFEWFLKALGDDFRGSIKVSENDPEPVGILDLIQIMCAVNPVLYGPTSTSVNEAYKNAGKCLQYFVQREDTHHFHDMKPLCRDIVRLYDYIRFNWKDAYNAEDESGRRGRIGARTEMQKRRRNRSALATYHFLGDEPVQGEVPVEKGFAIPLVSSFRALIEKDRKGKLKWYTDPFAYFDEHGSHLVRLIMTASDQAGGDPHQVGRDPQVYTSLYSEVRRWYLEGRFKDELSSE